MTSNVLTPRRGLALLLALVPLLVAGGPAADARSAGLAATIQDPYRPSQQTLVAFGERSHWLQPWRGYLDTVPSARVAHGLGIVFNPPPSRADRVAGEAAAAGIHHARLEISWCRVSYSEPARLTGMAPIRTLLLALRRHGLRPLILLNGNDGCPGPLRRQRIRLAAAAKSGDRSVVLDAASARAIAPGRTGLDEPGGKAAAYLFTGVSGTKATLSRPLGQSLAAGWQQASTLRYQPFTRPGDPQFEETMQGWLEYVGLVTSAVKQILGDDRFDVEVWNELAFGSDFLNANTYYVPPSAQTQPSETERTLLERTIAYIRDPSHGLPDVGIGDGFSNQRPWEAGSNVPAGLTAIDKHPYPPHRTFPRDAVYSRIAPLDVAGRTDGSVDSVGRWHDTFVPSYTSFFPEYFLSAIQTETVIRDLSPITTEIYGTPHGRNTSPPGSAPPAMWLTEAGMDPKYVPARVLPTFHAKGALRWATAWMNKGAARVYFYAVSSPGWGIVNPAAPDGGLPLRALGRLTRTLHIGAAPITRPRSLSLLTVSDPRGHRQFDGDGTAAHPPLYDAEVLGFFPFQSSNRRLVVALYVMTRDLMHVYRPQLRASDPRRYDMPPEWFRLTVGGVSGLGTKIAVSDPLTGRSTAFRVVSRTGGKLVLDIALTDSPRLLALG
jgi:hypothetical protein